MDDQRKQQQTGSTSPQLASSCAVNLDQVNWECDLLDPSLVSATDIPFDLSVPSWVLAIGSSSTRTEGAIDYPDTNYLTLRRIQNAAAAEDKFRQGLAAAAADRTKALQHFEEGLKIDPDHVGLQKALHEFSTTRKTMLQEVNAVKEKSSHFMTDAVLERALEEGKIPAASRTFKTSEDYPLLPYESKRDREKRRKKQRRHDDRKKRSSSSKKRKRRRRWRHNDDDQERTRDSVGSVCSSSVSTNATVDSRRVTRRRRAERSRS